MNKSALQDIQQALKAIRGEIERVDDAKRHRTDRLHTYSSTTIVTKSTRRQR